ncbi:hypothetical protein CP532_4339 [Ophiocordyceps camponoti-leonardi (nom. inval.)]|nr:hypothetical protein CP532_4339 [Ophiocordyceps camponoti-leonardi (nom. inval.)]
MSNLYSTVTTIGGRLIRAIPFAYNVSEQRQYVQVQDSDEPHVANKRCKLIPLHNVRASWIQDEDSLRKLVLNKDGLLDRFRLICNIISTTCGDDEELRTNMNKRLRPLQSVFGEMTGLTLAFTDIDDLCDAWFRNVDNCIKVLNVIYNIGFFFTHKNKHPLVPESLDYGLIDMDLEQIEMACLFLSAPALPSLCDEFLEIAPDRPDKQFPTDFTDRIVVDLKAVRKRCPVPSFVISEVFHERVSEAIPRHITRTELNRQFRLPGSFPEEDNKSPVQEEKEEARPDVTPKTPASPTVPSPPVIAKADTSSFRKWCADFMDWRIQDMTPQMFRAHFYRDSDAHRAIQNQYITNVEPRTQVAHPRRPRSILANRAIRRTPQRLATTRPPRTVRFTDNTISPRPRTHLGLDVPRLMDVDEERHSPADPPFIAGREQYNPSDPLFTVGRTPVRRLADDNAFLFSERFPSTLPIPTYFHDSTQEQTDEPYKPLFPHSEYRNDWRERDALRKAQAPAKLRELVNAPPCEGLTDVPLEELLERLIKKGRIDTSYRDAHRAKIRKAEEEARQKAEEEEAKRRAEEEAKRTLTATASKTLAKTSEGSDLRRHDFASVVPPSEWLNDEIINGTLLWMDKAINEAAGIEDVRRQTRKCLTLNSFFFKDLLNKGPCGTERKLRRCGVTKNNFLDVDTVLLPICHNAHWTMLVVRPGQKTVTHLDSLNPGGSPAFTALAVSWIKEFLQDKFVPAEWKVVRVEAPAQTNGHDCGVFALTNAMCMALGLSPMHSYAAADMPTQRMRIACMLLNGGFSGEFDLGQH